MQSADKCIESCKKYGIEPEIFPAFTPKDAPLEIIHRICERDSIFSRFKYEPYPERVASTFASQLMLWSRCAEDDVPYLILEHDARMISPLPDVQFDKLLNVGAPSWGDIPEEPEEGVLKQTISHNLGNHALLMKPEGAREIMDYLKGDGWVDVADVFLGQFRFDFIEKLVPYPFKVEDTFSTIQSKTFKEGITVKKKDIDSFEKYQEVDPDEGIHNNNNT